MKCFGFMTMVISITPSANVRENQLGLLMKNACATPKTLLVSDPNNFQRSESRQRELMGDFFYQMSTGIRVLHSG
jgi:hypothetical protein